uniref:Uncharacterized protein n=1 Tax=Plectus sambesii TaxID=2011161 RepID=A0A914XGP0_9BILA
MGLFGQLGDSAKTNPFHLPGVRTANCASGHAGG